MKTLGLALTLILLLPAGSLAGSNEGGVLVIHGNPGLALGTHAWPCKNIPIPDECAELIPRADPDPSTGLEWFLIIAAREPELLSFNTITFGVGDYDTGTCYIGLYGPCNDNENPLEIPSAGWPGPNSGTSVSWAPYCLEGTLVPVYYLGLYAYAPGGQIPLGDFYPGQPAAFVDCTSPPEEDPIADFGTLGCGGADGENPCPDEPTATASTTWGQIKTIYR